MRDFLARIDQTARNRLGLVQRACAQASFEFGARRRQDENTDRIGAHTIGPAAIGQLGTDLLRALPVDLQQHVAPLRQKRLDRRTRSTLQIAVHVRVFVEHIGRSHVLEHVARDEVVMPAIDLARPWQTRGVRHRQTDARLALQQRMHKAGLART